MTSFSLEAGVRCQGLPKRSEMNFEISLRETMLRSLGVSSSNTGNFLPINSPSRAVKLNTPAKELKRKDNCKEKDAISFLQTPMSWQDFAEVSEWHQRFVDIVTAKNDPLPRDILTRLSQMYLGSRVERHALGVAFSLLSPSDGGALQKKKPVRVLKELEICTQWNGHPV